MGFLKNAFRRKSKQRVKEKPERREDLWGSPIDPRLDYVARLPSNVLENIFRFVCPHTTDYSFDSNESVSLVQSCRCCDVQDLARCARVRRAWVVPVRAVLYYSIRLDAFHECDLRLVIELKRQKSGKDGPTQVAESLKLLAGALRSNRGLAAQVRFFKMPPRCRDDRDSYGDLARAVGAMPNLLYIDLPDEIFKGKQSCEPLRAELEARCQFLQKMKYDHGSEPHFAKLQRGLWPHLTTLTLISLDLDNASMRIALAKLPSLTELELINMGGIDDKVFLESPVAPNLRALSSLSIDKSPQITAEGLQSYLCRPDVARTLQTLTLTETQIQTKDLHLVLEAAPYLLTLTYSREINERFPLDPIPPLFSPRLVNLHYEVNWNIDNPATQGMTDSHYAYLSHSLLSQGLISLRKLWVREEHFADRLDLVPPSFQFGSSAPSLPAYGLTQPLTIFAKKQPSQTHMFDEILEELGYDITHLPGSSAYEAPNLYQPPANNRSSIVSLDDLADSSGGTRPLSTYSHSRGLGPSWRGQARKSMVVPRDDGGFLALPLPPEPDGRRPSSSHSTRSMGSRQLDENERKMLQEYAKKTRGDLFR
ncbi:hypothetical protein P152DRAFT_33368 [Eremomyces bilateralis CBS 781.70]|uniref:F-box domain-containing protein n=1 Tax=Eremomyces bilateralis CBS 781.70 TaxID=1392243 RepID=A0A6G1G2V9_9PEZI|nr:uncharacterized protein P152DRAFT_33368 [Eremomyces bilateralis CBS 781.70]KAF1812348.1 hypothetical protein P152DRAFT_33368 [Eremomyces bilateralis CBS 781.70]